MASTFEVQRSISIAAEPGAVFPWVADLKKWESWSPWEGMDPALKRTYSDETAGVGARYGWDGNRKVGQGSMTIAKVDDNASLDIDLEFLRPFKSSNKVRIEFEAKGEGSEVRWIMTGKLPFISKIMGLFGMNMDKMVGSDFEKGLSQLKSVVEG